MRLLPILLLASCASSCGNKEEIPACEWICVGEADCARECDYDEEPDCDPQQNYDDAYARCIDQCSAGAPERGATCAATLEEYATCVDAQTCEGHQSCDDRESDAYYEQCVAEPGDLSCFTVCAGLEVGCFPWETFGVHQECEATCGSAASELACMDALFALDTCMGENGGAGYSCAPLDGACEGRATAVEQACDGLDAAAPSSDEHAFCEGIAESRCACEGWAFDEDAEVCLAREKNRCGYELGRGDTCQEAMDAFRVCMDGVDECSRPNLLEACESAWEAWDLACVIGG